MREAWAARWIRLVVLLLTCLLSPVPASTADRIIYRDLTIESSRTVVSFDVDGVVLDDKSVIPWDRIKQATVADNQQGLDRMLAELSLPLLRIRQRLKTEDFRGAAEPAAQMLPKYRGRDSETAFLVMLAATWGNIASGRHEEALAPYLYCLEWIKRRRGKEIPWPGQRRLEVDLKTGLCTELPPLWTDPQRAAAVLPSVGQAIGAMEKPWLPGVRVYYASLARAAGEAERADLALRDLPRDTYWSLYRAIATAPSFDRADLETLSDGVQSTDAMQRTLSLYWLGRSGLDAEPGPSRDRAMVHLVRVAAVHGKQFPGVASHGLLLLMKELENAGDVAAAVAVRREILERYGTSSVADSLRQVEGGSPP